MRRVFLLAVSVGALVSSNCLAQETLVDPARVTVPHFVDVTASSRVDSVFKGEWQYMVGGGVATFDCEGRGFPSVFLAGGENKAKFFRNVSERGGELRFREEASGLEFDKVVGAYPIDIDGDGIVDLIVLRVGEAYAMRGLGGCKFERANDAWSFEGGDAWWTAMSATWERGANWPTLAMGAYIDRREEASPWGHCGDNELYRPLLVDGQSQRRFAPPLPLTPSFCSLSMLFSDWNKSGVPSLRVANDREYYEGGQEQMWRVEPGKPPALFTEAEGWKYLRIWGMGIASHDLKGDGYPDYFVTSMADNKLQTLERPAAGEAPRPEFKDLGYVKGVTTHWPYTGGDKRPSTAWHAQFADVNNDGFVDLFVAKGNVSAMPDFAARDPNSLLLQTADGKFQEAGEASGIASFDVGRGGAIADFNLSGKLDILVVNRNSPARLWRNVSDNLGHWIAFQLRQPGANVNAIGAWLEVRAGGRLQRREITIGGGHVSGQLGWIHFGLGEAREAEARVIWPGGETGAWAPITSDGFYLIAPGKAPEAWAAK